MPTPAWALTTSFWLHMLATVTWVGGLATLAIIIIPIAQKRLTPEAYASLLTGINKRLDAYGWLGLSVLTVTGLIQMGANPNYEGFLTVNTPWASAILFKHLAFLGIIAISATQTWSLTPALERVALLRAHGRPTPESETLAKRQRLLLNLNLFLGLLVLLLTALARIA